MKWLLLATMLDVVPAADVPFEQLRDAYAKCVWIDYFNQLLSPKADSVPLMVELATRTRSG